MKVRPRSTASLAMPLTSSFKVLQSAGFASSALVCRGPPGLALLSNPTLIGPPPRSDGGVTLVSAAGSLMPRGLHERPLPASGRPQDIGVQRFRAGGVHRETDARARGARFEGCGP